MTGAVVSMNGTGSRRLKPGSCPLEFGPRDETDAVAVGITGVEVEAQVAEIDGRGGAEAQGKARQRGRLSGEIAECRFVAELVRVAGFGIAWLEHIATGDLDAVLKDGAENDLPFGVRNKGVVRTGVEPGEIDECQHRIFVQGVEDIRVGVAHALGIFSQRDILDGATVVGEGNVDEVVGEVRDGFAGGVLLHRSEGGVVGRGRRRIGGGPGLALDA